MLFVLKEKKDFTGATLLVDYFLTHGNSDPIMMRDHSTRASGPSSSETETITFGYRLTPEMCELGMYRSFSVSVKSEQISGMLPTFRYIAIKPEAINKMNAEREGAAQWGKPVWPCGFDNLFAYNDSGDVVLQYSVMGLQAPLGRAYPHRPWAFSAYERATSTWGYLLHLTAPNETAWIHHISNPTNTSVHTLKQCSTGSRAFWGVTAGTSTFTQGPCVDNLIEGNGASVINVNHATSYYSGEFKKNLKDGKGRDLRMNTCTGEATFFRGTWFQDKRHGDFVVEYTSKAQEMNRIERGTYHMGKRVGLWSAQFKDGRESWFQADCHMVARQGEGLFEFVVVGDDKIRHPMPAAEFLSLLIQKQHYDLIAKMTEKSTHQSLLEIGALSAEKGGHHRTVACFAYSIAPVQPDFLHHPMLIDNTRLLAIFKLALQMLASAPNSPLYIAVKSGIDLYDPNLNQKMIVNHLVKVFPDVNYAEVHKKNAGRAIETYQQNIRKKYVLGILERIQMICTLLVDTSRPELRSLAQLLSELKREDDRLTEQHQLEIKRAEAERLKAQWSKVYLGLDETVLAFMREIRADEKTARTTIVDGSRSTAKALLTSSRLKAKDASTKSIQTPPASAVKNVALLRAGIFNQPAISVQPTRIRSAVNHCVLRLPSVVSAVLAKYPSHFVSDCFLIYKGMMIKALRAYQQPITPGEEALLGTAQVKENQYFLGFRNAFLSHSVLYSPLLDAADLHARALIFLTEGKKINLDDVVEVFKDASTSKCIIKKMMTLKCASAPEKRLISDEAALYKILFGLFIEICDDMGLGGLVDRRYFTGDYREYLEKIRAMMVMEAPDDSKLLLSGLGATAMSCFKRIIHVSCSAHMNAHVFPAVNCST